MSELEPTLEFRILGPLEVMRDEEVFSLGGTKPGEVLVVLLVHLNQPVSAELLIDALWDESPPPTARKSLQTHVWQLRKTLAPPDSESPSAEVIRTSGSGYVLEADPDQVDSLRFEALVNEALDHLDDGDGYHAKAAAEEGLSLWRGRALEGLNDRPMLMPEVTRLEELYARALEIQAEGRLMIGEHLEVVPDLRRLVADFPYRERLWEHLMLALYRSGRQSEALRAFQEVKDLLRRELGIEPGSGLQSLEERILSGDPALHLFEDDSSDHRASDPRPALGSFVGRRAELAALRGVFEQAVNGRGSTVLLTGEPGIGKTRVIHELGHHVRSRGSRVLWAHGEPETGAPPYSLFIQLLRQLVGGLDPPRRKAALGEEQRKLTHLLPDLRDKAEPSESLVGSPEARYRLFEAVTAVLHRFASHTPLVVVLDDLNWADPSSVELFRHISERVGNSRVLLAGTYRTGGDDETLTGLVAGLARTERFELLELKGLEHSEVAELLASAGKFLPSADTVTRIHRFTGGNPFFLKELVSLLVTEDLIEDWEVKVPSTVEAAVQQRLLSLPKAAQDVLSMAAIAGNRFFELGLLVQLAGVNVEEALSQVEVAVDAGLLTEGEGVDRFRFAHPIVREAIVGRLSSSRRLRLHAKAARVLEERHSDRPEPYAAELAFHYKQAARLQPDLHDKAFRYAGMAARQAEAASGWAEAAQLYENAIELVQDSGQVAERAALLTRLGVCRRLQQDVVRARNAFVDAFDLYHGEVDGRGMAEVALEAVRDPNALDEEGLVAMLETTLEANQNASPELRARLLAHRASGVAGYDEASDLAAKEAADLAERYELLDVQVQLGSRELHRALHEGRFADTRRHADEVIRLADQIGDTDMAAHAMSEKSDAYLNEGDLEGARQSAIAAREYAERHEEEYWAHDSVSALVAIAFLQADLATLQRHIADLVTGISLYRALALYDQAELKGDLATARRVWDEFARTIEIDSVFAPIRAAYHGLGARIFVAMGQPDEAREAVEAWKEALSESPPTAFATTAVSALAEETIALLDEDSAQYAYDIVEPHEAVVSILGRALDPIRGFLALHLGRLDEAERHFRQGLSLAEEKGWPLEIARSLKGLARVVEERGQAEEAARLGQAAEEALDSVFELSHFEAETQQV